MGDISVGDDVAGTALPGTIHHCESWTIDGKEYPRVGPVPPKFDDCQRTTPDAATELWTYKYLTIKLAECYVTYSPNRTDAAREATRVQWVFYA